MPKRTIEPISCSFTPALDGRHEDNAAADLGQAIKSPDFFGQNPWLASDDAICFWLKAVELEVDRGSDLGQVCQEAVVVGNPLAVGIKHHMPDTAILGSLEHGNDLTMDRWFAAGELDDLRVPLGLDQVIENSLHLFQGEVEADPGIGEAEGAVHVAAAIDFDDAQTGVLLVIRA